MADQGDIFSGGAQGGDKRGGGGLEGMEVTASTIESIEKDFVDVMKDLSAEENLDRFRAEFEKLHRALKKSHESEKRLIKKCQELNAEIVANAGKVQSALKLSQEDQNTIHALKKEVEKAWKMVDAAHEKEARAKEAISGLKKEIANLSQLVEQGAGLTVGQESSVQELVDQKKELTKELTTANQKVAAQGTEIKELSCATARLSQSLRFERTNSQSSMNGCNNSDATTKQQ
jgi:chromosome segregation ATPase